MTADFRGGTTGSVAAAATPQTLSYANGMYPTPQSFALVATTLLSTTATVTGITSGTATFIRVTSVIGSAATLEMWIGYNFGNSLPASLIISRSTSAAMMSSVRIIDVFGDAVSAPTITASAGGTGTSVTPDAGTITPAVGDILFAACGYSGTVIPTARTSSGNIVQFPVELAGGGVIASQSAAEARAAVSSGQTWTIASQPWAAAIAKINYAYTTPPAPTDALLVKGLETAALDQAANF